MRPRDGLRDEDHPIHAGQEPARLAGRGGREAAAMADHGEAGAATGQRAGMVEGEHVVEMHQVRAEAAHGLAQDARRGQVIAAQATHGAGGVPEAGAAWAAAHGRGQLAGLHRGRRGYAGRLALPARRGNARHRDVGLLEAGEGVDRGQSHQRLHLATVQMTDQVQQAEVGAARAGAEVDVEDA
ncbi:MAG: hypothetical protein V9H69_09885 [Anaerolineae bacterium]